jgi:rhomboid protease GluP
MEPSDAIIPVRSENQAMDWSLVLVSQGIEAAIERLPEEGRIVLVIGPDDQGRALAAIEQYERENHRHRWQQPIRWTGLLLDWRVLFCLLPLALIFFADDVVGLADLTSAGLMESAAVRQGQWWRLFTAVTLHADLGHLACNLASGALLIGMAMGSYGPGKALLASYLAGVGGNLAGLLFLEQSHRGLGASGMVLGALGLLTVPSFRFWGAEGGHRQRVGRAVAAGLLLLALLGLNPQTDVVAHVGGFVWGALMGLGLAFFPGRAMHHLWLDRSAGGLCLGIVLVTWWRALI